VLRIKNQALSAWHPSDGMFRVDEEERLFENNVGVATGRGKEAYPVGGEPLNRKHNQRSVDRSFRCEVTKTFQHNPS
jgi:hypothetical protein